MKIKTTLSGVIGILAAITSAAWADGRVEIYAPGASQGHMLSQVKDLRQLTADPAFGQYQPGMVIATPAATRQAEQDKQKVLGQLRAWAASEEGARAAAIQLVIAQLNGTKVAGRQFTSLDPVYIENNNQANRTLVGDYSLYQASASDSVTLMGPISGAGKVVWQPGRSIRDYLGGHDFLSGADLNEVTVIDPEGAVRVAPVAYWNHRHVEALPGSIIVVGFSAWALPGELDDINQHITSVLTHRIPD